MSKKKERNKNRTPAVQRHYTVAPLRKRKMLFSVMAALCLLCGVYMLLMTAVLSQNADGYTASLITSIVLGVLMFIFGIFYYPRQIAGRITVDGNNLIVHRLFQKDKTYSMKSVSLIEITSRKKTPVSTVPKEYTVHYGSDDTFTVVRDSYSQSEQFYKDLRSRGVRVK